jgi:peptidoglycan/LPS O-acetylase OafA/YrhL
MIGPGEFLAKWRDYFARTALGFAPDVHSQNARAGVLSSPPTKQAHHDLYRPDIDGLRAIAVLAVVGFHVFPGQFKGGFTGVDIFFVISGFLISGIIFRGMSAGTFSSLDFYGRRIRRIFPALIVVLLSCLVYGYFVLFSSEFARMSGHASAAAAFLANIKYLSETGYSGLGSETKPLLHLWSLGVEEQYYIVWPLVVGLLYFRVKRFSAVIFALLLMSFTSNLALTWREPNAAIFLPFPRFWELMLGSALAYLTCISPSSTDACATRRIKRWDSPALRDACSIAGVGLIATSILFFNSSMTWPGLAALLPTSGALLVIAAGRNAWINRRLLSHEYAIFFGKISYPLYLWHWPVFCFLHIELGRLHLAIRILAVLASVILAWATYRYIESPIRFDARRRAKITGLACTMAAIGIFALAASQASQPRDPRDVYFALFDAYSTSRELYAERRHECNFLDSENQSVRDRIADGCTTPAAGTSVLLWGDSHAEHLSWGLQKALPPGVSLLQITTSPCPPMFGAAFGQWMICERSNLEARRTIARVRPDIVVLAQKSDHLGTDWISLASEIRALGARAVIVVGPVPMWDPNLYVIVARRFWPTPPERIGRGLIQDRLRVDGELKRRLAASSLLHYVSIVDMMCRAGECRAFTGPDPEKDIVTYDDGHFTSSTSRHVVEQTLYPVIRELLGLSSPAHAHEADSHCQRVSVCSGSEWATGTGQRLRMTADRL